jgi:hypothetical protein
VERDGRAGCGARVVSGGGVGTVLTGGGILGVGVSPSWTLDTVESSTFPCTHNSLLTEHKVSPLGAP